MTQLTGGGGSCMRRLATLIGIILGFLAGAAIVLFGFGFVESDVSSIGASHAINPSNSSLQNLYAAMLLKDDKSLDRGMLEYSWILDLEAGTSTQFRVVVLDVGKGPEKEQFFAAGASARISGRWVITRQNVPTGGIVSLQILGCENLTCHSESSLRQPVLQQGQLAVWYWRITAGKPGPAMITLRADTYDQGSAQTLSEEIVQAPGYVTSTAPFEQQQNQNEIVDVVKSTVRDIVTIGSVATAIAAVGGVVGWLFARRRKRSGKHVRKARRWWVSVVVSFTVGATLMLLALSSAYWWP